MSGFSVQPTALETYAKMLGKDSGGLSGKCDTDAKTYIEKWARLKSGSGGLIFGLLVGKVNAVCEKMDHDYAAIATCLSRSSTGLTASASTYRDQAKSTAAHLDSVYKPGGVVPLDDGVDDKSPAPDPSLALAEPSGDGAVPDLAQQILDGAGFFSESEIVFKILSLCGLDVEGWVKDRFVGNLEEVAQSRNAIKNLATFDESTASTVSEGANSISISWRGNAASAATSYFDHLANGVEEHSTSLSQVAQRYDAIVIAIQQAGSAVMGFLTELIDYAVELAASLAAAGCLQEVPVLDVIMDVVGAWKVVRLIKKIREFVNMWNNIWSGGEGLVAAMTGLVGGLAGYDTSTALPKSGYHNDAQRGH
ncbi:MAG: hypothetical protein ACRDRL_05980 [Sciscionella sp.]